jgi:putative ABC transport system permease protein
MFRLTIKNLAANRIRLALTTFAVVLAVSFVVSSFVLTDGLRSSFGDLSSEIVGGTDLELRPDTDAAAWTPIDESVLGEVQAIDGVAAAAPTLFVDDQIRPIKPDGEQISSNGPPQIAAAWTDEERLNQSRVVEGRSPETGEFIIDLDAAANHGFEVGNSYDVITPQGVENLALVGLMSFGENNDTLGATLMQFDMDDLQRFTDQAGYDSIAVALTSDADSAAVSDQMAALAANVEVVDQTTLESEQRAEFNEGIDTLGNILLGFAFVSLFVSIFIIYNTFSIVLGQRTKELALLRTIGADPVQLKRSVRLEALVVGLVASITGIAGGVGVAYLLRAVFAAIGADLPESPVVVAPRTVGVAFAVGVGVTLLSAIGPASKASRIPPIAALRDGAAAGAAAGWIRLTAGAVLTAIGVAAGATGLFVASDTSAIITLLAIGAISVFVGFTMLSPLVATPFTRGLGLPLGAGAGMSGRLAGQNAGRNPQRTSTTAAALMIGLALVSMALTVGESVKAQLRSTLETSIHADYLAVESANEAFPAEVGQELLATGLVDELTGFSFDVGYVDVNGDGVTEVSRSGERVFIESVDLAAANQLFDIELAEGVSYAPDVADPVVVSDGEAEAAGLTVGDTVEMTFDSGQTRELTVIGIRTDSNFLDDPYLLDRSTWQAVGNQPMYGWMAFSVVDGVTDEQARAAFGALTADYPQVSFDSFGGYLDGIEAEIDGLLTFVNAMVALAVIIALVGIANTLALSVFERTRELGLLRAVGMTRRQLRRMIRLEAALVALFGAVTGVGIGVLFGWAAVAALPASFTSTLAVPTTRIFILVAVAGAAGLVAAWGPARRASRLDVLDAISA